MFVRAYLRASTDEQDARRAREDLEQFARERGLHVAAWYVETESGAKLARPELFRLLGDARAGDVLIAISSSGRSSNILAAVEVARTKDCRVVTFSGFGEDNELRRTGDVNFYIRSREYGFVEVGHLALCHAILDLDMGWGARKTEAKRAMVQIDG